MHVTRRNLIKSAALVAGAASTRNLHALASAPATPFEPTWESLRTLYRAPQFLQDRRLGIFIHWGAYAVPAYGNEWYARHMYNEDVAWHTAHYGPPDKFGYKDFIPLFTAQQYDPTAWARLFREAGAGYVVPVAEHHDGFAMYDSQLTRWCAAKMGPKRDVTGDLAKAVRAEGLLFGVSFHRMEHHTFEYPAAGVPNDQFDPRFADFYGPPQPGFMNDGLATETFQREWLARAIELVDKYQPQVFYFDNGINDRAYDKVKLEFAAHYYNRAAEWGREATIVSKDRAYLAGSVNTFEKMVRMPQWVYPGPWLSDDTISTNSWGYVDGMKYRPAAVIVTELIELACRGGGLLLNISPRADGTIPPEQQSILHEVGAWMRAHGHAINGSAPWSVYGEGPGVPSSPPADWKGGSTGDRANYLPGRKMPPPTAADYRFTTKDGALFVFGFGPQSEARITALRAGRCRVESVRMNGVPLRFHQTANACTVTLPAMSGELPFVLEARGSRPLAAA